MKMKPAMALLIGGLLVVGVAGPAHANSPTISLDSYSIARNASNGFLDVHAAATVSDYTSWTTGPCVSASSCALAIEVLRQSSNDEYSVSIVSSIADEASPYSHSFESETNVSRVVGIRAHLYGSLGDIATPWETVTDPLPAPSVEWTVNSAERNKSNGHLVVDADVSASNFFVPGSGVCTTATYACNVVVEGRRASDDAVLTLTYSVLYSSETYPATRHLVTDADVAEVDAIRVRVEGSDGEVKTDWEDFADPLRPSVSLKITSLHRDASTSTSIFDITLTGRDFSAPGAPCGPPTSSCYGSIEVRSLATGNPISLWSSSYLRTEPYPFTANAVDSISTAAFDAVRATIEGYNGSITTGWIPLSEAGVYNGHDVGQVQALAMVGFGAVSATEFCLTRFPFGLPVPDSSLNQFQASCLTASSSETAMAAFLSSTLPTLTAKQLVALLVAAGGVAPVMDEAYEDSATQTVTQNAPQPTTVNPAPVPVPRPEPDAVSRDNLRTCIKELARLVTSTQTLADLLALGSPDRVCVTMPVYFVGDIDQHGPHDLDELSIVQVPEWTMLTYGGKSQTGHRSWADTGPCLGQTTAQQCDEFPFYSTSQGYPTVNPPMLAPVLTEENQWQAATLRSLYRCPGIKAGPAPGPQPNFLVIPVPGFTLPSCGLVQ